MAMPIPPPMHREATPFWPPVLCSACNKVTSTLQPDMPIGWPREMAPPPTFTWGRKACLNEFFLQLSSVMWLTLTLSAFRPSSFTTAKVWAANASLISNKSTWSSCQPAFSTWQTQLWHQGLFKCSIFYRCPSSHRLSDGRYGSCSHDGRVKANLSWRHDSGQSFQATFLSLWLAHEDNCCCPIIDT